MNQWLENDSIISDSGFFLNRWVGKVINEKWREGNNDKMKTTLEDIIEIWNECFWLCSGILKNVKKNWEFMENFEENILLDIKKIYFY